MNTYLDTIDRPAREIASRIAQGEEPPRDVHPKTGLYGIVGRGLKKEALHNVNLPPSRHFGLLTFHLLEATMAVPQAIQDNWTKKDRDYVDDCLANLYPYESIEERLIVGASTSAKMKVIALRTLQATRPAEMALSEETVLGSWRTVHSLALMHLIDIERLNEDKIKDEGQGKIFTGLELRYDRKGMHLPHVPSFSTFEERRDHGPQIGCPVTLIPGYMKRLYSIAARSAYESKLMSIE